MKASKNDERMTLTARIRRIAETYGCHHSNVFYINMLEREIGYRCTHASVISAIGRRSSRDLVPSTTVLDAARRYVRTCDGDVNFAISTLRRETVKKADIGVRD